MTRSPLAKLPADLSDASLDGLDAQADAENTLLLYDNPELGVRFLYPRGWRVGAVQGKQVTLDHARGSGMLITVEPAAKVPTAEDYLKEIDGVSREGEGAGDRDRASRSGCGPSRCSSTASASTPTFGKDKARLEYAVLKQTDGGVDGGGPHPGGRRRPTQARGRAHHPQPVGDEEDRGSVMGGDSPLGRSPGEIPFASFFFFGRRSCMLIISTTTAKAIAA